MQPKRVLNVGGGEKKFPLPARYAGFEHVLLDIDPVGGPDIVCDARQLATLPAGQFDAVYCSHNLEHYFRHEVPAVLAGFWHVLSDDGFVEIRVPDIFAVMRLAFERGLDIDDAPFHSPTGPIMILDVLYGYSARIEQSGNDYYAHKTGFTRKSLLDALRRAGFPSRYAAASNLEIIALAFKRAPDASTRALFNLSDGPS